MKNILTFLLWIVGSTLVVKLPAQSLPVYSQYMSNMTNINPAFVGMSGTSNISMIWREQWVGIQGAPTTKSFTYETLLQNQKSGMGLQLFDDRYVNYIKRTGVNMYYSLQFPVSDKGVLSMGLKAGFYNDSRTLTDASAFQSGDIALSNNINKIVPIAGAGLYYKEKDFYFGVSVPDMITFASVQNYATDKNLYQVNEIHYFISSGLNIDLNEQLALQPSILLKSIKGAPLEADLNTRVWIEKKVGLGLSYRTSEAILALFDAQVYKQCRVGYAYDMPFKRPNSHELFLRYEFGKFLK